MHAVSQLLGYVFGLWGARLMLVGVRNWWTLGLLVAGAVLLVGHPTL
ncbi:hypothetical protein ACWX0K_24405 (plasmid) [Nitrobacteraceae bacterium UC4446_H13]